MNWRADQRAGVESDTREKRGFGEELAEQVALDAVVAQGQDLE